MVISEQMKLIVTCLRRCDCGSRHTLRRKREKPLTHCFMQQRRPGMITVTRWMTLQLRLLLGSLIAKSRPLHVGSFLTVTYNSRRRDGCESRRPVGSTCRNEYIPRRGKNSFVYGRG